jgi:hypothetical protein
MQMVASPLSPTGTRSRNACHDPFLDQRALILGKGGKHMEGQLPMRRVRIDGKAGEGL